MATDTKRYKGQGSAFGLRNCQAFVVLSLNVETKERDLTVHVTEGRTNPYAGNLDSRVMYFSLLDDTRETL